MYFILGFNTCVNTLSSKGPIFYVNVRNLALFSLFFLQTGVFMIQYKNYDKRRGIQLTFRANFV